MRATRNRLSLMPLIAVASLSLVFTLPALSSTQLHAAKPVTYATVTVKSGDNLWSLADERTPQGGDIQGTVDAIIAVNHLSNAQIAPGQHLRIPQ